MYFDHPVAIPTIIVFVLGWIGGFVSGVVALISVFGAAHNRSTDHPLGKFSSELWLLVPGVLNETGKQHRRRLLFAVAAFLLSAAIAIGAGILNHYYQVQSLGQPSSTSSNVAEQGQTRLSESKEGFGAMQSNKALQLSLVVRPTELWL